MMLHESAFRVIEVRRRGEKAFIYSLPSFLSSDWLSEFNHGKGLAGILAIELLYH